MTVGGWLAVVALVAALAAAACGGGSASGEDGEPRESVKGVVVRVEARSLTELEFIDVQDDTGFVWRFQPGEPYRGLMPSHLREHMVQGLPVTVMYCALGDVLVMEDVTD